MRNKSLLVMALLAIFIAAGCAPRATETAYRNMLEGYRGRHIDSLVAAWGPASGHHTFADGRQMYSFVRNRRQYVEPLYPSFGLGMGFYRRNFFGGYYFNDRSVIREYSCETTVTTDRKGQIIDFSYRGNACRAIAPTEADRRERSRSGSGTTSSYRR